MTEPRIGVAYGSRLWGQPVTGPNRAGTRQMAAEVRALRSTV
jgi:hypothetical protein